MPTVPTGSDDVVTASVGGVIARLSEAVAACEAESVVRTVNVLLPAVVGVPEIVPPLDRVSPAGSVPLAIDHV